MKTDRIKPPVAKGFETPKENEKTKSIPKTLKKTSHNSTSKKSKSKIIMLHYYRNLDVLFK